VYIFPVPFVAVLCRSLQEIKTIKRMWLLHKPSIHCAIWNRMRRIATSIELARCDCGEDTSEIRMNVMIFHSELYQSFNQVAHFHSNSVIKVIYLLNGIIILHSICLNILFCTDHLLCIDNNNNILFILNIGTIMLFNHIYNNAMILRFCIGLI
jgi:hypothetical protein